MGSKIPLPKFILHKPEYLSNALQQLFHNRERVLKTYVEARKRVALVEMEIAYSACPWHLGQYVSYFNHDDLKPISTKALISRIAFSELEPFYQVWIRPTNKYGAFAPAVKIVNLSHIIGATTSPPVSEEKLKQLIADGLVQLEKHTDVNDPEFSSKILKSYERGETLMTVSPQIQAILRESLRLGIRPEKI